MLPKDISLSTTGTYDAVFAGDQIEEAPAHP